jgi:hypothetical protein
MIPGHEDLNGAEARHAPATRVRLIAYSRDTWLAAVRAISLGDMAC